MIRTLSVPVEAFDTDLARFAASIDAAVGEACRGLEESGCEVVSLSPVPIRTSEDLGDGSRPNWASESGVVVVITYRGKNEG